MDIDLKNIALWERTRHGTNSVMAELHIDKNYEATIFYNGFPGSTVVIGLTPEAWLKVHEAGKYCNGLPKKVLDDGSISKRDFTLVDLVEDKVIIFKENLRKEEPRTIEEMRMLYQFHGKSAMTIEEKIARLTGQEVQEVIRLRRSQHPTTRARDDENRKFRKQ